MEFIVTAEISASAYPRSHWKNQRKCLVHAGVINEFGELLEVLCHSVQLDSVLDDSSIYYESPIDCPRCVSKLKR